MQNTDSGKAEIIIEPDRTIAVERALREMEMCHREGLYQIDLLNGSKNRITDREYWAQKKGQAALDKQNAPMIADGITPRQTKFETNKEKLRQTIRKALATAASFDEFSSLLLREGDRKSTRLNSSHRT